MVTCNQISDLPKIGSSMLWSFASIQPTRFAAFQRREIQTARERARQRMKNWMYLAFLSIYTLWGKYTWRRLCESHSFWERVCGRYFLRRRCVIISKSDKNVHISFGKVFSSVRVLMRGGGASLVMVRLYSKGEMPTRILSRVNFNSIDFCHHHIC